MKTLRSLVILGLVWGGFVYVLPSSNRAATASAPAASPLSSAAIEQAVTAALRGTEATDVSWEISETTGFLVVTVELPARRASSARQVGETTVLAVRNALSGQTSAKGYRVSVRGPSPGPKLVRLYGTARFIEGGSVTWTSAGRLLPS